jgi:hypothetical protein
MKACIWSLEKLVVGEGVREMDCLERLPEAPAEQRVVVDVHVVNVVWRVDLGNLEELDKYLLTTIEEV